MPVSPTDLSNLWAWYKGDAGVTGTSSVTAWADQSGNSRTLTIPGILGSPSLDATAINGLPAIVTLLGTQGLGTSVNLPVISEATVYIVGKQLDSESSLGAFIGSGGGNLDILRRTTSDVIAGDAGTGSIMLGPNIAATDDTWYTIRMRVTATDVYLSLNHGTEQTAARDSATIAAFTASPLFLFTDAAGHTGKKAIAECIVYLDNHSTLEKAQLEYYLNQKYAHYTWTDSIPSSSTSTTSMAQVNGKDVIVQVSTDGTTYKNLICEIANSVPLSRETTSVTTKCSGGTTARAAGAYSWDVTGEAIVDTAPTSGQISYEDLLSGFLATTLYYVKVENPSASGTNFYLAGTAYLTSLELTNEVDGLSQFSFTFSGTGAIDNTP